jgi:hypothetical protein
MVLAAVPFFNETDSILTCKLLSFGIIICILFLLHHNLHMCTYLSRIFAPIYSWFPLCRKGLALLVYQFLIIQRP